MHRCDHARLRVGMRSPIQAVELLCFDRQRGEHSLVGSPCMRMKANKSLMANRRSPTPLMLGVGLGAVVYAQRLLSAAVAYLCR